MAIDIEILNFDKVVKALKEVVDVKYIKPLLKEAAYDIKQAGDARNLVPRLSGNLQESALPTSDTDAEMEGDYTSIINYPAPYAKKLWYGVGLNFTLTENASAQAKWLEPVLNDKSFIDNMLQVLTKKHIIDKGVKEHGDIFKK